MFGLSTLSTYDRSCQRSIKIINEKKSFTPDRNNIFFWFFFKIKLSSISIWKRWNLKYGKMAILRVADTLIFLKVYYALNCQMSLTSPGGLQRSNSLNHDLKCVVRHHNTESFTWVLITTLMFGQPLYVVHFLWTDVNKEASTVPFCLKISFQIKSILS